MKLMLHLQILSLWMNVLFCGLEALVTHYFLQYSGGSTICDKHGSEGMPEEMGVAFCEADLAGQTLYSLLHTTDRDMVSIFV